MKNYLSISHLLLSLCLLTVMASCELINVSPENSYCEKNSTDNNTTPEITSQTINGTTWYEINGTFESSSDTDFYTMNVAPGVGTTSWHVFHNGTEIKSDFFGINTFPLTVDDGNTIFINAASKANISISSASGTIIIIVYATSRTLLNTALPYTSGSYTIKFK